MENLKDFVSKSLYISESIKFDKHTKEEPDEKDASKTVRITVVDKNGDPTSKVIYIKASDLGKDLKNSDKWLQELGKVGGKELKMRDDDYISCASWSEDDGDWAQFGAVRKNGKVELFDTDEMHIDESGEDDEETEETEDTKGASKDSDEGGDEDKYWKMVDAIRDGDGETEEKMAKLRRKLGKDEFEKFTDWVGDKAWAAQSAAEEAELHMSDDAIQYASFGAVLAGKESYEYALEAPDEMSSYESEGEEFCYGQDPEGDFQDEPEDDGEDEPKKDKDGNILKDEEVKDPKTGKKIKVVTHTGPRGGKFYWPDGAPKDAKHKVYVKEEMSSLCNYINSKFD